MPGAIPLNEENLDLGFEPPFCLVCGEPAPLVKREHVNIRDCAEPPPSPAEARSRLFRRTIRIQAPLCRRHRRNAILRRAVYGVGIGLFTLILASYLFVTIKPRLPFLIVPVCVAAWMGVAAGRSRSGGVEPDLLVERKDGGRDLVWLNPPPGLGARLRPLDYPVPPQRTFDEIGTPATPWLLTIPLRGEQPYFGNDPPLCLICGAPATGFRKVEVALADGPPDEDGQRIHHTPGPRSLQPRTTPPVLVTVQAPLCAEELKKERRFSLSGGFGCLMILLLIVSFSAISVVWPETMFANAVDKGYVTWLFLGLVLVWIANARHPRDLTARVLDEGSERCLAWRNPPRELDREIHRRRCRRAATARD
ncbi:MAG: hypothetical protein AAB074_11620 [Planctomycetota bacterium]